jgi:hypothetical protein
MLERLIDVAVPMMLVIALAALLVGALDDYFSEKK